MTDDEDDEDDDDEDDMVHNLWNQIFVSMMELNPNTGKR